MAQCPCKHSWSNQSLHVGNFSRHVYRSWCWHVVSICSRLVLDLVCKQQTDQNCKKNTRRKIQEETYRCGPANLRHGDSADCGCQPDKVSGLDWIRMSMFWHWLPLFVEILSFWASRSEWSASTLSFWCWGSLGVQWFCVVGAAHCASELFDSASTASSCQTVFDNYKEQNFPWKRSSEWKGSWARRARARAKTASIWRPFWRARARGAPRTPFTLRTPFKGNCVKATKWFDRFLVQPSSAWGGFGITTNGRLVKTNLCGRWVLQPVAQPVMGGLLSWIWCSQPTFKAGGKIDAGRSLSAGPTVAATSASSGEEQPKKRLRS